MRSRKKVFRPYSSKSKTSSSKERNSHVKHLSLTLDSKSFTKYTFHRMCTQPATPQTDLLNNSMRFNMSTRSTRCSQYFPEPSRTSTKHNGLVMGYGINTSKGLTKDYNEDRVSVLMNVIQPPDSGDKKWPKCSYFGVYDGHSGGAWADFLRDNLHKYVIQHKAFPWDPKSALEGGFAQAENAWLRIAEGHTLDKSGSCASVVLIVGDVVTTASVGDSRVIMSGQAGLKTYKISTDHKPSDSSEAQRIIAAGGRVYIQKKPRLHSTGNEDWLDGPTRVIPGGLSVSRAFGDAHVKLEKYGGRPGVVTAEPAIQTFRLKTEYDFITIASDGIFDRMTNKEVNECAWMTINSNKFKELHSACGKMAEGVVTEAMSLKSQDNVSVVVIAFSGLRNFLRQKYNPS